jgi:iron complex transport system substrate-binding protein
MAAWRPERIVCLTAETTEIAFALGCGDRVVGVSGYAVRPPEARRKPRVAAFSTAHVDRILDLNPDLVLGFSDLQAGIAAELVRRGAQVLVTNQRSLEETYAAIGLIAGTLGEPRAGSRLVVAMRAEMDAIAERAAKLPSRPRVYFEEWDDPMISGIEWVSDLVTLSGGEDIFSDRISPAAAQRTVTSEEVVRANPAVIVASWCGKKAQLARISTRLGWEGLSAVKEGRLYEIKAPDILQPGPSLVHGARQLEGMIRAAACGEAYSKR